MTDPTSDLNGRCGSCGYFHSARHDADKGTIVGDCSYGAWPPVRPQTSSCPAYVPAGALARGEKAPKGKRAVHGRARSTWSDRDEVQPVRVQRAPIEIEVDMDEATFRTVLREVLAEELGLGDTPIGERWRDGEMVLRPGKEGTQEKRMPLNAFFHKIVMVRDKLRVLEQKINGSPKLADDEKVALQQYVTGIYGSLTSFNVLFKNDEDRFVGASSDRE